MSDQPLTPRQRRDRFRIHKRKGRAGTETYGTKVVPPKAVTAARKRRDALAKAVGVETKDPAEILRALSNPEIKERIGMSAADVDTLNGIASGANVPRNSVAILGAQKLKLSVHGLLTQNLNVTTSLADAVAEAAAKIGTKP